jgi:hypothetical protein
MKKDISKKNEKGNCLMLNKYSTPLNVYNQCIAGYYTFLYMFIISVHVSLNRAYEASILEASGLKGLE